MKICRFEYLLLLSAQHEEPAIDRGFSHVCFLSCLLTRYPRTPYPLCALRTVP
ncbi:hypothetical protein BDZ91DRAFT_726827 [Kalaharituber pfeilii]|nr:hypothetical protein BDZ91DRAFT_726786 [Kalaharituber pfeilii]KAF8465720.1 hypothetical protein BDZ91DRAFT_726827 [Kalaharituber pfeilii]